MIARRVESSTRLVRLSYTGMQAGLKCSNHATLDPVTSACDTRGPHWRTNIMLKTPKIIALSLAATFLLGGVSVASAAAPSIAVVDLQKVLVSTKAGKAAKAKFERMQKRKRKQLKRRGKDLKNQMKKLMAERKQLEQKVRAAGGKPTMELQQRAQIWAQKAQTLQKEELLFQKNQQKALAELAKKEIELLKPIEDKIRSTVAQIAKARGFSMVVNRVAVVYAVGSADITDVVIAKMGR